MRWMCRAISLTVLLATLRTFPAPAETTSARLDFGTEESAPIVPHGNIKRDQDGPQPPEFPDFEPGNTAVHLDGKGAYFAIADPGEHSPYDFGNGDAITMEAWVDVDRIGNGQNMYIMGKGRTGAPDFPKNNQNWSMRLLGRKDGIAHLSTIFATTADTGEYQFHRWTSTSTFQVDTGWHHIAIEYRYGDPESIRGWIDGTPTGGTWDRGGKTTKPPVQDDDEIWIGSSQGGNPASSFQGYLDAVAIHRTIFDAKTMVARFNRLGGPRTNEPLPEVMPDLAALPTDQVLMTFAEGMPSHTRWLNEGEQWPSETARWSGSAFLLPRIPLRFDPWGARTGWTSPILLRIAADVALNPGDQRFLVRARGLSRLWIDGTAVARTEAFPRLRADGQHPVTPLATPPHPGLRPHGHRMQEVFGTYRVPESGGAETTTCRVVLEIIVGGTDLRAESGEVVVAVASEDGRSYDVLRPAGLRSIPLPLTDEALIPELASIDASLTTLDDNTRRLQAAEHDAFWQARHNAAKSWAQSHPLPPPPTRNTAETAHPVDAFILNRIDEARSAATGQNREGATNFHENVLPILQNECFRCHGEKEKGGLRLNSREAALKAGDSEIPAVIAGDPEASGLITRIMSEDEDIRMPPKGDGLSDDMIATLKDWIASGAPWPAPPGAADNAILAPILPDAPFLRRVFLDTIGVPPSAGELQAFLADPDPYKRFTWIATLLDDALVADNRMGEWLDLLAENPTLANPALNSTGPFRWFIYDALRDHLPVDRMVTELIMMRGDKDRGGSAGFAMAAENDAPMAAKGHILASAFLGVEMQCARCHDAPYHRSTQRDLFSLAAMLTRKPVKAPASSSVPADFFAKLDRPPLIKVTLKPGEAVAPEWPFPELAAFEADTLADFMQNPNDARERLAAAITAPQNERFAQVMVNRVWKRLMGAGLVEPVYDWEGHPPSHPALLQWLARQLITHDYDIRHIEWLILTSDTYQRQAMGNNREAAPEQRFFNAPDRRRLAAEQIVDCLYAATNTPMEVERLTFVHDGRRPVSYRQDLGQPVRGWMFASLSNERDRPTLTLPRAQAVVDVLTAFGWTGDRQMPVTHREDEPNLLQPGILENGTLSLTLTRAAEGSALARWAVEAESADSLVEQLFLQLLTRMPSPEEQSAFSAIVSAGFESRIVPPGARKRPAPPEPLPLITWFNNLDAEAANIQIEKARRVNQGPMPDHRLQPEWRERYEDVVWSLINHHEFVWMP